MSNTNPGPATTSSGPTSLPFGNVQQVALLSVALTPAQVAANTTAEQTFTVNGLLAGDFVEVNKPTTQAGLGVVNARVSAANTLAIAFSNNTGAGITPTAGESYQLLVVRPIASALSAGLPSSLPLP
jgi:hypothetical protein